jgi:hypothetical protein
MNDLAALPIGNFRQQAPFYGLHVSCERIEHEWHNLSRGPCGGHWHRPVLLWVALIFIAPHKFDRVREPSAMSLLSILLQVVSKGGCFEICYGIRRLGGAFDSGAGR